MDVNILEELTVALFRVAVDTVRIRSDCFFRHLREYTASQPKTLLRSEITSVLHRSIFVVNITFCVSRYLQHPIRNFIRRFSFKHRQFHTNCCSFFVVVIVISRIILFWDLLIYYFPRNFKIDFN